MNQTLGTTSGKKPQSEQIPQRRDLPASALLDPNDYLEKPRPNFYNVIKKIRESKMGYKRVLYVAKLNEAEMKGELEKDLTNYFRGISQDKEFSGLNLIFGSYCIHFLEGEGSTVNAMLKTLNEYSQQQNSLYSQIWIIHQTEETSSKVFQTWLCRNVMIGGSTREIKQMQQFEKAWIIYESMLEIGKQINLVMGKGASQINHTIKNMASELIPTGEELQSVVGESEMTLNEYLSFISEPPDIVLEKELVWPVEPDLIY